MREDGSGLPYQLWTKPIEPEPPRDPESARKTWPVIRFQSHETKGACRSNRWRGSPGRVMNPPFPLQNLFTSTSPGCRKAYTLPFMIEAAPRLTRISADFPGNKGGKIKFNPITEGIGFMQMSGIFIVFQDIPAPVITF